jgi:hypothetical protein
MNGGGGNVDEGSTSQGGPPAAQECASLPMRNPYGVKKTQNAAVTLDGKQRKIVQNPYNNKTAINAIIFGASCPGRDDPPSDADTEKRTISDPLNLQAESNSSRSSTSVPLLAQNDAAPQDNTAENQRNNSTKATGNISYWERMPSRTLTFGPAEILTVTECIQHAALYIDRSVRVTGLLHHRRFLAGNGENDVVVQLELRDPLQSQPGQPPELQSKPRTSLSARRKSSGLFTRSLSLPNNNSNQHSAPSVQMSKLTASSATTSSSSKKRPKPWFANSNKVQTTSDSLLRRSLAPEGLLRNRPKKTIGILKVLVDPSMPQLGAATVGSVIMVMGTIIKAEENVDAGAPVEAEIVSVTPRNHSLALLKPPPPPSIQYKVEARIVSVLPKVGADMALFSTALHVRRKALYQRYQQQKLADRHDNNKQNAAFESLLATIAPIQGCGPPPYEPLLGKGSVSNTF